MDKTENKTEKVEKESEFRTSFTCNVTAVNAVRTAIEEKAFLMNLVVTTHRIGGVLEQTWGLKVKGKTEKAEKFGVWLQESLPELCRTKVNVLSKFLG
jgi:hypothetical protein